MRYLSRLTPARAVSLLAFLLMFAVPLLPAAEKSSKGKQKKAAAKPTEPASENSQEAASPATQLLLDPQVQAELKLEARQLEALKSAYAKIEKPLWLARDYTSGPRAAEKAKLTASLEAAMAGVLAPQQVERLSQLVVQAVGWPIVRTPALASRLDLSTDQLQRVDEVLASTQKKLQEAAAANQSAAEREKTVLEIRTEQGAAIQKILSPKQRQKLVELVGTTFDLSQIRPLIYTAPDLQTVDAWIQSPPLELAKLRGKVVAFHFWAFGCINCVHNLPHYNEWHRQFADRGLVVLGMHTPETKNERDLAALRKNVEEREIRYPVAVDHDNQNWAAWANSMWPSVYLVDKRGQVRYWWYGEMNWQGTQGEKFMRQKIEALLAEKD